MINFMIPIAGKSRFFKNSQGQFPKPLYEILGKPMIQIAIEALKLKSNDFKFIFVLRNEDCEKYHLNNTVKLIVKEEPTIIVQNGETKGAACSCLLAIELINNNSELIISNPDHLIDIHIDEAIIELRKSQCEAGVITFDSVHPQWSYVKIDLNGFVLEAAEKNPISRNAIAGFYYFKHGSNFVRAAQKMILKEASVNEQFYIAPCLNELILEGKKIKSLKIENQNYHSFYSIEKIKEFEANLKANSIKEKLRLI